MASRIPLFRNTSGLYQPFASGDNFNAQTGKVINLGAGTAANDALAFGQSGAELSGLNLLAQKLTNLAAATAANEGLAYGQSGAQLSGLDLQNQKLTSAAAATTNGDGLVYGQSGAVLSGLDVGNQPITNVPLTPTADQQAASKYYVDQMAQGLHWLKPADYATTRSIDLNTNGLTAVDGTALTAGQRILVKDQTDPIENGVYIAAVGPWNRASDMPNGYDSSGSAIWVKQGSMNADTAWAETADPGVVNTDPLTFIQFSSAAGYTAGNGISIVSYQISVDLSGTPGLQFITGGPDDGLAVLPNETSGAIEVVAAGVQVKLDGTTLQIGVNGLSVRGLPSAFEINGFATNPSVSASALNAVTGGPSSDASGFHFHNVVKQADVAAGTALSACDPVYVTGNAIVSKAQATTLGANQVVGVAEADTLITDPAVIITHGIAGGFSTPIPTLAAGDAVYLAPGGGPTKTIPSTAGDRLIRLGTALDTDLVLIDIQDLGTV